MNQVVKVGLGSLVVALMFTMSLAKVAEAKCVAQTLQVHSGWGQTGTHIGSVTLFGDTVVADDGDNVCVSFQKDGKKKYGQWACRRGTVEFVQFLSLKSSFNDPSSCKHRHKGSFSAK